jgi:phosphate transport system protein
MRDIYHEQLDDILAELERMTRTVSNAVRRSTNALLTTDLGTAEEVIAADAQLDATGELVEEKVVDLIARQAPVATELRMLVTRLRYPLPAIPVELEDLIEDMGRVAQRMVDQAGDVIHSRDVSAAHRIESTDDEMDKLRSNQFRLMMDASWPHGVEVAVDIALLGRYYERIADHAVSMARRVIFLVTGEMPAAQ